MSKSSLSSSQTEAQFQAAVIELAEALGWKVAHFSDSRRQVRPGVFVGDKQAAGFPDLVLCRTSPKVSGWNVSEARIIFAELKVGKKKPTPKQQEWLDTLNRAAMRMGSTYQAAKQRQGVSVYVWRPDDWPAIEAELTNRFPVPKEEESGSSQ